MARLGVTRVAELTHLDRLGFPVFQAVRPMSRALSVHQGKGASDDDARVSAIMEAAESAAAEAIEPAGPHAAYADLPIGNRCNGLADYGWRHRNTVLSDRQPMQWHEAAAVDSGRRLMVPFDTVTLDMTRTCDSPFVRSSTGLAAGANEADALAAAAFELVEREAQARWLKSGMVAQTMAKVDIASIDCTWVAAVADHLAGIDLSLSVYALSGLGNLPVVICRIDEPGHAPSFAGAACRVDAGDALLRAFGEAVQSRLTVISGNRDDIEPDEPVLTGIAAIGPPTGTPHVDWRRFRDDGRASDPLQALCDAGFAPLRIDYPAPCEGIAVVKLIAPGLAVDPAMLA